MESMFSSRDRVFPVYFEIVREHAAITVHDEAVDDERHQGSGRWCVVDVAVELSASGHETGKDTGNARSTWRGCGSGGTAMREGGCGRECYEEERCKEAQYS